MVPAASRAESRAGVTPFLAWSFCASWLLWGYWVWAMPPGGVQISPVFIACALAGGLAPSVAALALTWRSAGASACLRFLGSAFSGFRQVSPAWLVMLVPPLAAIGIAGFAPSLAGPLSPPGQDIVLMALIWPVMAALGEEFGWRGYLFPRLETRLGLWPAALVVGLAWGLWHLPADYIGLKGYGEWFWVAFVVNGPLVLTAHALIMAWLWKQTGGSLSAMLAYHASITASAMFAPSGRDGEPGVVAALVGVAIVWSFALVLMFVDWRSSASRNRA